MIYNIIGVPVLWIIFRVYSIFNSKVREGFKGRRDLFRELNISLLSLNEDKRVLIHSSSLGEFQQALPLVEELSKKKYDAVLSFFSPSGYNNSKISFPNAVKCYLPFDSASNQKKFLDTIKPEIIILMRYDLWYNLLYEAKERGIMIILANARYDEKDLSWKIPVMSSFKKTLYGMLDKIFVIDEFDEKNYKKKLSDVNTKIIKIGDSKFERVYQSAKRFDPKDRLLPDEIIRGKKIFVMGSSWKDDEDVILPAIDKSLEYNKDLLTLLVPHEPKEAKIEAIEKTIENRFKNIRPVRYSVIENYKDENLIIIDKIGMLSRLYSIAYMSYVGGGFRTGLHNILEPAIFNMPILFSNAVKNSDEDEALISSGCGILVNDSKQFYRNFRELLNDRSYRDETGAKCRQLFINNIGVAEKIINDITQR
ncbi:MAG: glycosyltransferase N-terminal domain-containing protein [Ignavibacteria bacterium]